MSLPLHVTLAGVCVATVYHGHSSLLLDCLFLFHWYGRTPFVTPYVVVDVQAAFPNWIQLKTAFAVGVSFLPVLLENVIPLSWRSVSRTPAAITLSFMSSIE